MSRRSSSTPSNSDRLFSCGKSPSSSPVTNTVWNSRPFAAWTVISCSAGRPSAACVSPASSAAWARNAVSGSVAPSSAATSRSLAGRDRRIDGEIGLAQERGGGVDELLEILEAILPVLLGLVVRDEARGVVHVRDGLRQRQSRGRRPHGVDQLHERGEAAARLAGRLAAARGLPQARPGAARRVLQRSRACARRCHAAEN